VREWSLDVREERTVRDPRIQMVREVERLGRFFSLRGRVVFERVIGRVTDVPTCKKVMGNCLRSEASVRRVESQRCALRGKDKSVRQESTGMMVAVLRASRCAPYDGRATEGYGRSASGCVGFVWRRRAVVSHHSGDDIYVAIYCRDGLQASKAKRGDILRRRRRMCPGTSSR
jgi:hypothetical protein